ncbi:phosphoglycerate mutase [Halobacillus andaensis]|uniref:Phosphoglycerate mutase n=1 Tax=Halobacillus andaensis TaxID=1176239 RepID=A0A917B969_HALAA|nr:histidine phosphatase family protein [Halobacillus andaensis]MBP2005514.1 putative phosphoglycerate mutase [Halobacillus andaensis]GGF32090.1 phosphoglycerate mutase [Halobacillus andaensis]
MRIGLIRHGSTAWNKAGRAQGHSDIPLDDQGHADALALGEKLREDKWSCVYSSDLTRAHETAQKIIDGGLTGELITDRRLREVGGGLIEGTTEEERIAKWGEEWRQLELGIEKRETALERALDFLEEVTNKHKNKSILIVSHGSILKHLIGELLGERIERSLENTSLTILELNDGAWQKKVINDMSHLHN